MINCLKKMAGGRVNPLASHFLVFSLVFFMGANTSMAANVKNYDQRISHLERLLENQNLIEMLTTMQRLQREVSQLRGDMELLNHELDEIKNQQKQIYLDLDQRLLELNKRIMSGAAVSVSQPASVAPVPVVPDSTEVPVNDQQALSEQEGYQAALAVLKEGRYEDAIEAFQIYLITYPSSVYAANAQYWMAEAYYVLKDYQSAIAQFNKVISAYPDSRKVPDAYLKVGFSFYEMQDWQNSRKALEKIMSDFAESTAARLAERRLQKLKQEGNL